MADPMNTIIDRFPLTNGAGFFEYFNDTLYCSGSSIQRINLSTREITQIGPPATWTSAMTAVDFHRPWDVSPDVIGSGAPEGRIYVATFSDDYADGDGWVSADDFEAAEIFPPLLDRFTPFKLSPQAASTYRPVVSAMAVSSDAKYLYFFDVTTFMLGVVDLEAGPRMLGGFQLDHWSMDMVLSPDNRFLYVAHPFANRISVVDTTAWPSAVREFPVVNGPWGLALSADGNRLFVAQTGDSASGDPSDLGNGTLSVFDAHTMQGQWLNTGERSINVVVNPAGTRAYVSNQPSSGFASGTVSVVDVAGSAEVIATISGFGYPSAMRLNADGTRLYVLDWSSTSSVAVAAV